jgi:hypothetical protein
MGLYNIDESDVITTINREIKEETSGEDRRSVVNQDLSSKYGFPLKVVFIQTGQGIIVISTYPVRKERRQ